MKNSCKICRRLGQKLFLKGEKCFSPKCPLIRKPYQPGQKRKRTGKKGGVSEYGKELREKQKVREYYGIEERQFRRYIKEILKKRGKIEDTAFELIKRLEKRLDNVVLRLGFSRSRRQARQLVSHNYFLVNKKPVNIPSFGVKKGDVISLKPKKKEKQFFKGLSLYIKQVQPPSWLRLDKEKMEGKVIGEPNLEEAGAPAEISSIFEFYSR
ncbi:MAG: 30S ribosomal protein S4 [Patescibacteria group bacterium]|nr:30S ribosomal protein S4 [Patescibacteria group bacterium]